jgi:hypothetical protein
MPPARAGKASHACNIVQGVLLFQCQPWLLRSHSPNPLKVNVLTPQREEANMGKAPPPPGKKKRTSKSKSQTNPREATSPPSPPKKERKAEETDKAQAQRLLELFEGVKGRPPKTDQELEDWLASDEGKVAAMFEPASTSRWGEGRS